MTPCIGSTKEHGRQALAAHRNGINITSAVRASFQTHYGKFEPVFTGSSRDKLEIMFRDSKGRVGVMDHRCPHRCASLFLGRNEKEGIRCAYHGWKFDGRGGCLEQPSEAADSTFRQRVRIPAYPVQELGGLLWAYLGPQPAPLLPRYDLLVRDDLEREIGITRLPCNWLQIMENSLDPVHLEYLHGRFANHVMKRQGLPAAAKVRHHEKIRFTVFEYGISKHRLLAGDSEDSDDWQVGHPPLVDANPCLSQDCPICSKRPFFRRYMFWAITGC